MSIYIKSMEMPKENDYTIAIVYGDGVVTEYHEDYWIRGADGEKQIGTAVPIPPHGDLIERDALKPYMLNEHYKYRLVYDEVEVANAPTIIEANKSE